MTVTLTTVTTSPVPVKYPKHTLKLQTPYNPNMPAQCRKLGGIWEATEKAWYFDPRDSARVGALCLVTYGVDPTAPDPAALVDVRVHLDEVDFARQQEVWMFGRRVLYRPERDKPVYYGDGVIVLAGGCPGSGRSRHNPQVNYLAGTILEVRDVPRSLLETYSHLPGLCEVVEVHA